MAIKKTIPPEDRQASLAHMQAAFDQRVHRDRLRECRACHGFSTLDRTGMCDECGGVVAAEHDDDGFQLTAG